MNATVLNAPLVSDWTDHLVVLPIVLPIAVAGAMFLMDERRSRLKGALSLATVLALLGISLILVWRASEAASSADTRPSPSPTFPVAGIPPSIMGS